MTTQGGKNHLEKKRLSPENKGPQQPTIEHIKPIESDLEKIAQEIAGDEAFAVNEIIYPVRSEDILDETDAPKRTKASPPPPPRRKPKKDRLAQFVVENFSSTGAETEPEQDIPKEILDDLSQKIVGKYMRAAKVAAYSTRVNETARWKPYIREIQSIEPPKKRDKSEPPETPQANLTADARKILLDAGIKHVTPNQELQKIITEKIRENTQNLAKIRDTEETEGIVNEVGAGILMQREALSALRSLFEAEPSTLSPENAAKILDQAREQTIAQANEERNTRLAKERKEDEPFRKEVSQRLNSELKILLTELEDQKAKKQHSPTQPMKTFTPSLWEKIKSKLPSFKERPEVITYQPAYESVDDLEKDIGVDALKTTEFTPFEELEGVLGSRLNRISDEIDELLAAHKKHNTPISITNLEDVVTLGDIALKKLIIQQESIARSIVIIENRKNLDKVVFERRQKKRGRTTKLLVLTSDFKALKTRILTRVMATIPRA